MRRTLTIAALVCLLVPALAAADAAERPAWALGWVDGLQLRHQINDVWDVQLGAGPNDTLEDRDEWYYEDDFDSEPGSHRVEPTQDKTESGWVRLGVGRTLFEEDRLRFGAVLDCRYHWSHGSSEWNSSSIHSTYERYNKTLSDRENYTLSLKLRPEVRIGKRATVQTTFGLYYSWFWSRWVDLDRTYEEGLLTEFRRHVVERSGHSFNDTGWDGMGSLAFLFWF